MAPYLSVGFVRGNLAEILGASILEESLGLL